MKTLYIFLFGRKLTKIVVSIFQVPYLVHIHFGQVYHCNLATEVIIRAYFR